MSVGPRVESGSVPRHAGVKVLDPVMVAGDEHCSFANTGLLDDLCLETLAAAAHGQDATGDEPGFAAAPKCRNGRVLVRLGTRAEGVTLAKTGFDERTG